MDEPDKQQRGVSNNNKQTGNTNTNTSKKICSGTDASTRARSHNTETNRVHKKRPKNDTHLFVRPRTPEQNNKHISTDGQKGKRKEPSIPFDKHKQPSHKKRLIFEAPNITNTIQNRSNMDPNDDRDGGTTSIHYHVDRSKFYKQYRNEQNRYNT